MSFLERTFIGTYYLKLSLANPIWDQSPTIRFLSFYFLLFFNRDQSPTWRLATQYRALGYRLITWNLGSTHGVHWHFCLCHFDGSKPKDKKEMLLLRRKELWVLYAMCFATRR